MQYTSRADQNPPASENNVNEKPQAPPKPPSAHPDDYEAEAVPAELRETPQWVAWRWVFRDGKWTKPPINPLDGKPSDATNPDTWMEFEKARDLGRECGDGIGYALGPKGL